MYERATGISEGFQTMVNSLSPPDGVLRPAELDQAFKNWKRAQRGLPELLRIQTQVNAGQIACALERYRLARGAYPDTFEALVPQFIVKPPRDFINGQPFTYRRIETGGFQSMVTSWTSMTVRGTAVCTGA